MGEPTIKPAFKERYEQLTDWDAFKAISLTFLRRSIRVNTIKRPVAEIKERLEKNWTLTQVPWCREGFWMESDRRDIGNTLEHALGYIYVQEAASMIPPIVLDPQPGEINLDMCAAPGSKATQIAQYMNNEGTLLMNDYTGLRLKSLGMNVQRCGVMGAVITRQYGHQFSRLGMQFDRILVDAPCSGTGTIRKSFKTLKIWNPTMIRRLAATQKKLVLSAFDCLKEGGTLVYSTCSLEPEEDEGVVDHILSERKDAKIQPITLDIKRSPPVTSFEKYHYSDEVKHCLRIWPQDNDTEGFFVAKLIKK
ncbi:MAG: NOL1/NOP2/sun family putative RNA methylase [Nanoarchaeota archaeon]